MKYILKVGIILSFCFVNVAMATDFYVNPMGNDLWSGTLKQQNLQRTNGPFKTLERAKQAIRNLKQTNTFNDKVTVNIATGTYYLSQPLNFNLVDSGLPGREVLWQGEPGGQVTISAGLPINCKKRNSKFWDCPVLKTPVSSEYFDGYRIKGNTPKFELFVNDQKLELARWPDQGWAHIGMPLDQATKFSVMETMPNFMGNTKNAQVHIFASNDWYDQYIGIDSVDMSGNAITLSDVTAYGLESGRRFYIQNLPSLLNAPGEWIYDTATKKVSFASLTGMVPKAFVLSSLPNIVIAEDVNYLTFKNIRFQHSTGTAITLKNTDTVVLDQLDVNNIGGIGVEIIDGRNVQLSNSKIHHTGGHGVIVSGGDLKTLQASGHVIQNNYIHHMGTVILTYSSGVEVHGVGATVTHNLLEQGAGTAILIEGNEHLIEKNELHHFCLQASDCGAIYTGRNWTWRGNVIRNNYIHDIIGYGMQSVDVANNRVVYQSPDGARGVYLDDGASGFDVSGNIFENAGFMAIHVGGGRDNKIVNNYFNNPDYAIYIDDRWPTYDWDQNNQQSLDASPYQTALWRSAYPELAVPMHNKAWPERNRIERNVIVTSKPNGEPLSYFVPKDSTVIANNLIWSITGEPLVSYKVLETDSGVYGGGWSQWLAEGIEQGSIVADPCVTISNKKMTTCPGSPVNQIGFIPLPTDIGLIQ